MVWIDTPIMYCQRCDSLVEIHGFYSWLYRCCDFLCLPVHYAFTVWALRKRFDGFEMRRVLFICLLYRERHRLFTDRVLGLRFVRNCADLLNSFHTGVMKKPFHRVANLIN